MEMKTFSANSLLKHALLLFQKVTFCQESTDRNRPVSNKIENHEPYQDQKNFENFGPIRTIALAVRGSLVSIYYRFYYPCFSDTMRFNVDDIRVCKILGSTMENSRIIPAMVFKRFVDSEVKNVKNAKIAVSTNHPP